MCNVKCDKLPSEKDFHHLGKVTTLKTDNIFCLPNFRDYNVEVEKKVGKYIPDLSYWIPDKQDPEKQYIAVFFEVVDTRKVSLLKECWCKNRNIGLLVLLIDEWSQKYKHYPDFLKNQIYQDFENYVLDILHGKNNINKLRVLSERDCKKIIFIDNQYVTLTHYETIDINDEDKDFHIIATDSDDRTYHMYFCKKDKKIEEIENTVKQIKSKCNDSVYVIKSDKDCWIDSLDGKLEIKKYE